MFHLPFEDRVEAGRLLARALASRGSLPGEFGGAVLALTRGGVPVGCAVADRLSLPLEPMVVRKLGVPWQPELAMGAITSTTRVLDVPMIEQLGISEAEVEDVISREQAEVRQREERYRGNLPPIELRDRSVILVDDGLATGSTMLAAVRHVRELHPAEVIVAVPVGSRYACDLVRAEVDEFVCLEMPERFISVGQFYRNFEQVTDDEVRNMLTACHMQLRKHRASAAPG